MLLINVLKTGDIVSLKLISGEEVVGKLIDQANNTYSLDRPVVLAMGQQGMQMIPYMITADSEICEFKFRDQHVIQAMPTAKQLANQYIQGTTGIVPAGSI